MKGELPARLALRADGAVVVNDGPLRTMTMLWSDGVTTWLDRRLAAIFGLEVKTALDLAGDSVREVSGLSHIAWPGVRRLIQHQQAQRAETIAALASRLAERRADAEALMDEVKRASFDDVHVQARALDIVASLDADEKALEELGQRGEAFAQLLDDISDPSLTFRIEEVLWVLLQALPLAPSRPAPPSWVYFIESTATGLIKIGFTNDIRKRTRALASQGGMEVRILATMPGHRDAEQELHRRFAAHRQIGEWFAPAEELLAFIASLPTTDPGRAG